MKNKKGQLSIGDAPTVVMIVGLTFLVMATIAFIGEKYGEAMPSDNSARINNETLTTVTESGEYIVKNTKCNFENFVVLNVTNASEGQSLPVSNYTYNSRGLVWYRGLAAAGSGFNNSNWNVTYTYDYAGVACDVNTDLQTSLSDNTSIAGIVLTISLVGIVLSILIGVFLGVRRAGSRI